MNANGMNEKIISRGERCVSVDASGNGIGSIMEGY